MPTKKVILYDSVSSVLTAAEAATAATNDAINIATGLVVQLSEGNTGAQNTALIEAAIATNGIVTIPSGTYSVESINISRSDVFISGFGKEKTILRMVVNGVAESDKQMFYVDCTTDRDNINFSKMTFDMNGIGESAVHFYGVRSNSDKVSNTRFTECSFKNCNVTTNSRVAPSTINIAYIYYECFGEYVTIKDSKFDVSTVSYNIHGVRFHWDGNGVYNELDQDKPVIITDNIFIGNTDSSGRSASLIHGTGAGGRMFGPAIILNNIFQESRCYWYHGGTAIFKNNTFENVSSIAAQKQDGGALWADTSIYEGVSSTRLQTVIENNTFLNITGNAIYTEDSVGCVIFGNRFIDVNKRTIAGTLTSEIDGQYKYTSDGQTLTVEDYGSGGDPNTDPVLYTYSSLGGNCILLGGGVRHATISANSFRGSEAPAIRTSAAVSAKTPSDAIRNVTITNNWFAAIAESTILIEDFFNYFVIDKNKFEGSGTNPYAINVSIINQDYSSEGSQIINNKFDDYDTAIACQTEITNGTTGFVIDNNTFSSCNVDIDWDNFRGILGSNILSSSSSLNINTSYATGRFKPNSDNDVVAISNQSNGVRVKEFGTVTKTTVAGGRVNLDHTLQSTPSFATVSALGNTPYIVQVTDLFSASIDFYVYDTSGAAVVGATIDFSYIISMGSAV